MCRREDRFKEELGEETQTSPEGPGGPCSSHENHMTPGAARFILLALQATHSSYIHRHTPSFLSLLSSAQPALTDLEGMKK